MYGLTTIKGLINHKGLKLTLLAIAAFISFSAISKAVQAQAAARYECPFCEKALSATDTLAESRLIQPYAGFKGGVSVGVARGQTVRIVFRTTDDGPVLEPSGKPEVIVGAGSTPGGHVKVFDSNGDPLQIQDLIVTAAGLHSIDIKRDELAVMGEPGTGRIQLWIELMLVGTKVSVPTFEVFDNESGKTTVSGSMKESIETMKKTWKDAS
jgi:hypothetical protein